MSEPPKPGPERLSKKALEKIADVFRVLAEPTRLAILQELKAGPSTVGNLVERLGYSQANVSKHLRILADGGFLERERAGTSNHYKISDPMVMKLCELVCHRLNQQASEQPTHYTI